MTEKFEFHFEQKFIYSFIVVLIGLVLSISAILNKIVLPKYTLFLFIIFLAIGFILDFKYNCNY